MNAATRQPSFLEKLSQELQYLIDPELRFGCRCEPDAFAVLGQASNEDWECLGTIPNRVFESDHFP